MAIDAKLVKTNKDALMTIARAYGRAGQKFVITKSEADKATVVQLVGQYFDAHVQCLQDAAEAAAATAGPIQKKLDAFVAGKDKFVADYLAAYRVGDSAKPKPVAAPAPDPAPAPTP